MEISPIIAQDALRGLERVVFASAAVISGLALARCAYLATGSGLHALKNAGRSLRAHVTWRALPLIGLATAFPAPAEAAPTASSAGLDRFPSDRSIEPPWAGVSGFSPPRLLARSRGSTTSVDHVHPAIHGPRAIVPKLQDAIEDQQRVVTPLFPRADRTPAHAGARRQLQVSAQKRRAMRIHPAGSGLLRPDSGHGAQRGRRYVVRPGDTLWGIAEVALKTSDVRRIARYWPLIHRANRDIVGRDPNLIYPGQVLHLPPEK